MRAATTLTLSLALSTAACGAALPPPIAPTRGATQSGYASYYSDRLAGRSTASGEPYDPRAMTAAHRTLPMGTRVEVRRVDSGAAVVVRVNDRGPYAGERRVIDLSRAAAESLRMIRAGVVPVEVRVIEAPRSNRH